MRKVKFGELPGDVPRRVKIRMLEGPLEAIEGKFWSIPIGAVRAFRKYMKRKTIKVERRQGKMPKILTLADVPSELGSQWLQHLRDFDAANPGCHFQVIIDEAEATMEEMESKLRDIKPGFKFFERFKKP